MRKFSDVKLKLEPELHAKFKNICHERGQSMQFTLEKLIESYIVYAQQHEIDHQIKFVGAD